jgi:hypothetical protein
MAFDSSVDKIVVPTGATRSRWLKALKQMDVTDEWQEVLTTAKTTAYQAANRAAMGAVVPSDFEYGASRNADGTSTLFVRRKQNA